MAVVDWVEVEKHLQLSYSNIKIVGQGGMGRAYAVTDKSGAPKVVKTTLIPDDRYMKSEYDLLVYLRHPNLAYVYKSFYAFGSLGMEMQWYTGGDLYAALQRDRIASEVMAPMFCGVLCGLRHIHQNTIVHRDMKPRNILFDHGGRALITDFGLAVVDDGKLSMLCGTENYQAPEMLQRLRYGTAADIWAFGRIVRAVCAMEADDPPPIAADTVCPWIIELELMASFDAPYKRKSADWLFGIVHAVLGLLKNDVPLGRMASNKASSSAQPGIGQLCRAVGMANELCEARKAERQLKQDSASSFHIDNIEDLADAEEKRKVLATQRNKGRKARRRAQKMTENTSL